MKQSTYDVIESALTMFFPLPTSTKKARQATDDYLSGRIPLTAFKIFMITNYTNCEDTEHYIAVVEGVKVAINITNLSDPKHLNQWMKQKYNKHKEMIEQLELKLL